MRDKVTLRQGMLNLSNLFIPCSPPPLFFFKTELYLYRHEQKLQTPFIFIPSHYEVLCTVLPLVLGCHLWTLVQPKQQTVALGGCASLNLRMQKWCLVFANLRPCAVETMCDESASYVAYMFVVFKICCQLALYKISRNCLKMYASFRNSPVHTGLFLDCRVGVTVAALLVLQSTWKL